MKIRFVRSGGFAGLRLVLDVDTDDPSAPEASELPALILEARNALVDAPRSRPRPDQFEYHLTIDLGQGEPEMHTLCEADVPERVRPLIDQLTTMARRQRR